MPNNYTLVCGMEVHAELNTISKMFCGCKNDPFGAEKPNIYTCPVCLGMPGGLPVPNARAVEKTIQFGLALNCKIHLFSHFDRKNYFYPDLAKGYQISQLDQPFCYDGVVETELGPVRIERIHLEEDTGKLLHQTVNGKKVSLIDFNRCGVPLMEIVTAPDIHSAEHAKAYTKELRKILRYLGIANCDMEQGGMRLEANISLRPESETELPTYKVEVKNINSFRFLEKAITFEIGRQTQILEKGDTPLQETRGWNEAKNETVYQREKDDAENYRYFPDPDLPPLRFTQKQVDDWSAALPELPAVLAERWKATHGIEARTTEILVETMGDAKWFEELFQAAQRENISVSALANDIVNKKISIGDERSIQSTISAYIQAHQTAEVDTSELDAAIAAVLTENPDAVANFRAGKAQVLGFFLGQVQRKMGKKLDGKMLSEALQAKLR